MAPPLDGGLPVAVNPKDVLKRLSVRGAHVAACVAPGHARVRPGGSISHGVTRAAAGARTGTHAS